MIRIATWNINGVRARINVLCEWLQQKRPDVVCLQEIKAVNDVFPHTIIEDLGYNIALVGQKGFNGVAILSLKPIEITREALPGDDDDTAARYIEALIPWQDRGIIRIGCLYAPNGNPVDSGKFTYKLNWLQRFEQYSRELLTLNEPLILAGDYNIAPEEIDCDNPDSWRGDAVFSPEARQSFRRMINSGLIDSLRATNDEGEIYTFWGYRGNAWQRNHGIRIDHMLLSPQSADNLHSIEICKDVRDWEKPSDHVPVMISLD